MELGNFSVSLAVKDLEESKKFYEKLRKLKAQGVTLTTEADEKTTGPASFIVVDPDGNPVLVDQHV